MAFRSTWEYVLAAVIMAIAVVIVLLVADYIGTAWAGLIAALPLLVPLTIAFLSQDQVAEFAFFDAWGEFAYFIAALILFAAVGYAGINKWLGILIFLTAWLAIAILAFWFWSTNPPEVLKDSSDLK